MRIYENIERLKGLITELEKEKLAVKEVVNACEDGSQDKKDAIVELDRITVKINRYLMEVEFLSNPNTLVRYTRRPLDIAQTSLI